jgi:hypothetical protein
MEPLFVRPEIALESFLPIFVESSLVLIFGAAYAGIITLSKMGFLSRKWVPAGYLFWGLQTYMLYDVAVLIHSNHFTIKVLMVTMVAYLFIPHLYYHLVVSSEARYENGENEGE